METWIGPSLDEDIQLPGHETIFLQALQELETQNKLISQNIREYKPPIAEVIGSRKYGESDEHELNHITEGAEESAGESVLMMSGEGRDVYDFDDDDDS